MPGLDSLDDTLAQKLGTAVKARYIHVFDSLAALQKTRGKRVGQTAYVLSAGFLEIYGWAGTGWQLLASGSGSLPEHGNEYHDPEFEEEGVAAGLIATHAADEDAHHERYTNAEAITATKPTYVFSFGTKIDGEAYSP